MDDRVDRVFGALSHGVRRAILARLLDGEATVTELAEPFGISQPAISRHLRVLEEAGLVVRGRDAQARPRRLDAGGLRVAAEWLEPYRTRWEGTFQGLEALMDKLRALEQKL